MVSSSVAYDIICDVVDTLVGKSTNCLNIPLVDQLKRAVAKGMRVAIVSSDAAGAQKRLRDPFERDLPTVPFLEKWGNTTIRTNLVIDDETPAELVYCTYEQHAKSQGGRLPESEMGKLKGFIDAWTPEAGGKGAGGVAQIPGSKPVLHHMAHCRCV